MSKIVVLTYLNNSVRYICRQTNNIIVDTDVKQL